jgi:anion-transporting  ArsA/GET3 family ATPase
VLSLADLCKRRFLVILGKGGVGRTTVAATIGMLFARRGLRTLLFQANAKERLSSLLGSAPVGDEVSCLRDNLFAVNTNPQAALHQYGLMVLRYEAIYRMVLENRVAKGLLRAIPGLDVYAMLGKAWWHTTEREGNRPRWDRIIVDAPATGHALHMLQIPRAILAAVPEGPLTRDAVKIREMLEDPAQTAAVLVTLAEEMPTTETIELARRLREELEMNVHCLVVNQLYPQRLGDGSPGSRVMDALDGTAADDPVLAPLLARGRLSRTRRQINDRYLERLAREVPLPQIRLPMVFAPTLGPAQVEALANDFEAQATARG